jgi:hypothetical protein
MENEKIRGRLVGGHFKRPSRVGSESFVAWGIFDQFAILSSEGVYGINPISSL